MAQFQIKLLTPSIRNGTTQFLETPMTEFYTQQNLYEHKNQLYQADQFIFPDTQTFCYTYNEKLELHQNAQKLLTFNMDRKMFINNAWTTNPFAANIHVGTQLLLIDKYENEYIFIITKIDYTNKENNMSYTISCQDLFTYQMSRQNSGYTISNDAETEDFIGVRTIDDWVINFIQPDCFINYTYLTLNQGLYITNDNQIKTFIADERLQNVKKIIKPVYLDSAYQETIPFAISGSNADAALIALGAEIGLSIATYEHNTYNGDTRSGFFVKYFWFEPTKKADRITGLTFSPKSDVQDFSFSHSGDSLTTVLNVEASEGSETEESVSLFPAVPTFFAQYFSSQEWQTSSYYTGMFTDLINNKTYVLNTNQTDNGRVHFPILSGSIVYTDFKTAMLENCSSDKNPSCFMLTENGYRHLYIPIWLTTSDTPYGTAVKNLFYISSFYDHVAFKSVNTDDTANTNHISLSTIDKDNNENILLVDLNDYSSALTLVKRTITEKNGETTVKYSDPVDCYMDRGVIPTEFLGADQIAFIKVTIPNDLIILGINDAYINLVFYRDTSPEEREFAAVADACPWLENKIIDFRYFYNQNIINKYEYNTLTNTFNNDLRIANGNLLLYSQQYYKALHDKTEEVSKIVADLDALGAAVYGDILEPYKETGAAASDLTAFKNAYELVMKRLRGNNQRSSIANWSDTLTEYWTKYWNAEQRFFKNIYNFKNYFNMTASIGDEHSAIYRDTIELDSNLDFSNLVDGDPVNYITLTANGFTDVNSNFSLYDTNVNSASYGKPFVTLFEKSNNQTLEIVDKSNYKNYYVPTATTDSTYLCDDTRSQYKAWKTYYQYAVVIRTPNPIKIDTSHDYSAYIYQEASDIAVPVYFYKAENVPIKTYDEDGEHISYSCTYYFLPYTADWFKYTFSKAPRMWIGQTLYTDLTMELMPVDASYIKTRYLLGLSDDDFNKKHFYARKDNIYTQVNRLPNNMASFLGGIYSRQAILNSAIVGRSFIKADKTSEVITDSNIKNFFNDFLSHITTEPPINQGYIVPPINTFYYYGPKIVLSDDPTSQSTVHRLNSQNQSCDDIRGIEGAEDPFSYMDYFKVAYVDASNASSAYRNVASAGCQELNSPWMAGVGAVGAVVGGLMMNPFIGVLGMGLVLITSINALCLAFSPITASTSGICVADINQKRFSNTEEWFASYKEFTYPVYFPTNDSSVNYITYWKEAQENRNYCDYNLNNQRVQYNDGAYWFNFYNLISFNYELLANPSSSWDGNPSLNRDIQRHMYYKDKTYQLLSVPSDVINNRDKYYLVIVSGEEDIADPNIANYMWKEDGYTTWFNNLISGTSGYGYIAKWQDDYQHNYISALTQYPFIDRAIALTTSAFDWKGRTTVPVSELLRSIFSDLTIDDDKPYAVFRGGLQNSVLQSVVFVLREQSETTVPVVAAQYSGTGYIQRSDETIRGNILYLADTNLEYNALNEPDVVKGLYTNYDTNTNYQTPTEFNDKSTYYKLVDGAYYPCYTIWQVISQINFAVYTDNFLYSTVNLTDNVLSLDLPVYLNQAIFRNLGTLLTIIVEDWNLNSETTVSYINRAWSINSANSNIAGQEFVLNNFEVQDDGTAMLSFSSDTFPTKYRDELETQLLSIGYREQLIEPTRWEVQSSDRFSLTNIQTVESNALVHFTVNSVLDKSSDKDLPITINQANIRYTTTYRWTGERIASLQNLSNGTFWFLYHNAQLYPTLMERAALIETQLQSYWNEAYTASLYCEYFLPEYWQTYADETINYFSGWIYTYDGEKVCLSNQLLPDVQIFTKNGVSKLTSYQLKYRTSKDVLNQVNERMTSAQQQVNKTPHYNADELLSDNVAITNAMKSLNENLVNWSAEPLGTATTTYYYANSGGLKWPRALSIFANHNSGDYDDYAGWYILFYRIWKESYKDRSFPLYEQYLTQHNSIWRQLYNNYPGIILENTYSNENAVSSLDLLTMAQLYFKDLAQPERQYDISIIDVANLDGYDGHELQLGDPIAINASEYYDDHDEVYQTLLQYMFITDMSYSLRSDGDIQLTVNSIKYQDKLIQNLAKLIK